jgi:hypothetical protein
MGIHLLHSAHGNECMGTHDVVHHIFAFVVWDASFHMGWEQLHVLPSTMFNSFRSWINIVFTKNGICTLVDVVINNPMHVDLFFWSCPTQEFVTFNTTQTQEMTYYNRHLIDQLLFLVIEVFGCLHKQIDVFLQDCANAIWSFKRE